MTPILGDLHNDGRGDAVHAIDVAGTVSMWGQTTRSDGTTTDPTRILATAGQTSLDKTLTGDFDGDGRADVAVLHQQEPSRMTLRVGRGGHNTIAAPVELWDSGSGNWEWARSKPAVGDFDGDGRDDIAVIYYYASTTQNIFVFRSTSTSSSMSFAVTGWQGPSGFAEWLRMKVFGGDFNGDGPGRLRPPVPL